MRGLLTALALLLGVATTAASARAEMAPVRVALGEGLRVVEIGAAELVTVLDVTTRRALFGLRGPAVTRIVSVAGGLEVGGRRVGGSAVRLEGRRGLFRVGARDYVGALEVWRGADGLVLINELPLEEYVAGTVRAEASERWPAQALRALAVVTRTYALFQQGRNGTKPFHLVAGSQDQNFAGRVPEGSPAWEAARATAGQVLAWQGRVFPAFHHSDSGGFTEPPQTVFSGEGIPPLPGVRDEFSLDSPNYTWAVTLPLAAIGERLRQGGLDVGEVARLTVLDRSPSLRVTRIAVEHARGTATLKGTDFRRLVGYDALKSTLFVPVVSEDMVRFEGRGWGHGVGLSQYGAKGMAERGYAYPQILEHYYPGTALVTTR